MHRFHSLYSKHRNKSIHSGFPLWVKDEVSKWYKHSSVCQLQNHHSAMQQTPQTQPTQQHKQLNWKLVDILPSPIWIQITASNLAASLLRHTHRGKKKKKKGHNGSCFHCQNSAAHVPTENINPLSAGLLYFTQRPVLSYKRFQSKNSQSALLKIII